MRARISRIAMYGAEHMRESRRYCVLRWLLSLPLGDVFFVLESSLVRFFDNGFCEGWSVLVVFAACVLLE